MGSYQRDWSDKIEVSLCEERGLDKTKNNFSIADATSKNGDIYEIKATSNENYSMNTLANIGQSSLTDYGVFDCISWRNFRRSDFDRIKSKLSLEHSMKEIKDTFPLIKESIESLALEDKKQYINLLSHNEIDKEKLKVFVMNCLLGTCKKKSYKKDITMEDFKKSYLILVNNKMETKDINKFEMFNELDLDNLFIKYSDGATSIKVSNNEHDILSISFHWKNKFQGGETPCLNVFLSSYFKV